jgi:L-lactate dehydrogenase complex protein LldG
MSQPDLEKTFCAAAEAVGAEVTSVVDVEAVVDYVKQLATGPVMVPQFASDERLGLAAALKAGGVALLQSDLRQGADTAAVGVTGANFAFAATGTVVLESTAEDIRLATTLPEHHVVLLDPSKILTDDLAAIPYLRAFHENSPRNYLAYITGPSRTADIERVLTIGVHGPKRLHILLLSGLSDDPLEM